MDVNWFFSSLAQCAAALVSVLAALAVAVLLREREVAIHWRSRQRAVARRVAARTRSLLLPRRTFIDLWERNIARHLNGPLPCKIDLPVLPALSGSIGGPAVIRIEGSDREPLEKLLSHAESLEQMLNPEALGHWMRGDKRASLSFEAITGMQRDLRAFEASWQGRDVARLVSGAADELSTLLTELRQFDRLRRDANAAVPVGAFRWIVLLIAFTSATSVLYPLLQLAAPSGEARALAVGIFAAGLAGLIALLVWLVEGVARALLVENRDLEPDAVSLPAPSQAS